MSHSDGRTKPATFTLNPEQIEWVDAEAKRLEAETGGVVVVSRSAIVRRALDEARKRQDGNGDGR